MSVSNISMSGTRRSVKSRRRSKSRRRYGGDEAGRVGITDGELEMLHDQYEMDNEFGPAQPTTNMISPLGGAPVLGDIFQTAGRRRYSRKSKRSRKSRHSRKRGGVRKKTKSRKSRRKSRKSRKMKGGMYDWTKVGSDIIESTLTPNGITEKARIVDYNVGLPKGLSYKY